MKNPEVVALPVISTSPSTLKSAAMVEEAVIYIPALVEVGEIAPSSPAL